MYRAPILLAALTASAAFAASTINGQVMVVEDSTGVQHDPSNLPPLALMGQTLCQFASKGLYTQLADDYDGVVMFTTHPMNTMELSLQNTMLGNIVRQTDQGISETAFGTLGGNPAVTYGSPAKLGQCVFMGSLGMLPVNPDDQVTMLFGGFIPLGMGVTGAELMGHEYGHHWLLWASYDKNDGKGKRYLLRGDNNDGSDPSNTTPQPNGHWNHYADARSVMYGSFITPQGGGSFELKGGIRKYNEFDQYFMGLRAPADVSPILIVDDGSGRGAAVQPLWRTSSTTMTGTSFTVDVQDVIRSLGARNPSTTTSQKCFRVAFVLVTHQGHTATTAELNKIETYRQRFQTWFNFATDGRGFMDTTLTGPPGCQISTDGGVIAPPDAGTPVVDGGAAPDAGTVSDAGAVIPDAGRDLDAGTPAVEDAGQPVQGEDASVPDAGHRPDKSETIVPLDTLKLRNGCGCGAGSAGPLLALGLLGALLRRRRPVG